MDSTLGDGISSKHMIENLVHPMKNFEHMRKKIVTHGGHTNFEILRFDAINVSTHKWCIVYKSPITCYSLKFTVFEYLLFK